MNMAPMIPIKFDSIDWSMILIVFAFVLADVLTGVLNACLHGEFMSTKMRNGLIHKAGTLSMLLVAGLCDVAVANSTTDLGIPFGVIDVFGVLIIAMELGSIWENCCEMNPDLKNLPFSSIFGITQDGGNESE